MKGDATRHGESAVNRRFSWSQLIDDWSWNMLCVAAFVLCNSR